MLYLSKKSSRLWSQGCKEGGYEYIYCCNYSLHMFINNNNNMCISSENARSSSRCHVPFKNKIEH